ncbi:uncharacterized protein LOC129058776 [Pongo abelii]|uniref:uncharacterized protein LOC129058776 n=1 Tax=Pongo abelii TaxID=9601 RepID=UPI0023E8B381|nr:uncharacterized protein LOC129058776 [Pongo abelii]
MRGLGQRCAPPLSRQPSLRSPGAAWASCPPRWSLELESDTAHVRASCASPTASRTEEPGEAGGKGRPSNSPTPRSHPYPPGLGRPSPRGAGGVLAREALSPGGRIRQRRHVFKGFWAGRGGSCLESQHFGRPRRWITRSGVQDQPGQEDITNSACSKMNSSRYMERCEEENIAISYVAVYESSTCSTPSPILEVVNVVGHSDIH